MSISKPARLNKVARDFNVSINTIVEFLEEKGVNIEAKPTTKIEPSVYEILMGEFAADKEMKEKSSEISSRTREQKESISIDSNQPVVVKEELKEINLDALKPTETPEASTPAPAPEKEVAPEVKPEPVVETPKVEEPKAEEVVETPKVDEAPKEEEVVAEKPKVQGLKVIDKIDLNPKPAKKAEPVKEKPPVVEKKEATPPPAAVKPPAATPVASSEPETIRAEVRKLSGTKVVGKIVLPVEKKPSSDAEKRKRKRKRVKVNIDKTINTGTNNRSSGNRGGGNSGSGGNKFNKKKPDFKKPELSQEAIQKQLKETMARLSGKGKNKSAKLRRAKRDAVAQKTEEELLKAEEESQSLNY